MTTQILEPLDFPEAAIERLRAAGPVIVGESTDTSAVTCVFTRLAHRIDAGFHQRYPALRWVVSPTTGLNHLDMTYLEGAGVGVLSLKGRTEFLDTIHATAEHTIAICLALLRQLPTAVQAVREGRWDRYPHKGRELAGKTVLLLGFGRIGRQLARLYAAFGCKVLAHDTVTGRVPAEFACDYLAALAQADILSVHVPLAASTTGLVDAALLARLPAHAVVVNTARGEVVDQAALLDALSAGRLAGAALDVLVDEPDALTNAVKAHIADLGDRLVITPHIGGFTHESLDAVELHMTDLYLAAISDAA